MNKRITEDYVSYETAKLLKEKGFNEMTELAYGLEHGHIRSDLPVSYWRNSEIGEYKFSCPTLQMALKWMREIQSIYITSEPDINDKHCFYPAIYTMTEESWDMQSFEELEKLSFNKPEQAVEAALKYTLKNLI